MSRANYDVAPDGQGFVMVQVGPADLVPTKVNVVLNWFEELKHTAPTAASNRANCAP